MISNAVTTVTILNDILWGVELNGKNVAKKSLKATSIGSLYNRALKKKILIDRKLNMMLDKKGASDHERTIRFMNL